jgi:hypothetical protein
MPCVTSGAAFRRFLLNEAVLYAKHFCWNRRFKVLCHARHHAERSRSGGNMHGVSRAAGNNSPYWGRKSPQGLGWRRKPFNLPLDQIIVLKSTDETRSNALQTAYSAGANYFWIQFSPRLLLL